MDESFSRDRLQPFLLDRLTDDAPENSRESRDQRAGTLRQLRKSVLRDLEWLLNTPCHFDAEELKDFPLVTQSVVNYGIPNLSGQTVSGMPPERVEKMLINAIHRFEPRVIRHSLSIGSVGGAGKPNTLDFEIRGEIWAVPLPDVLFVRTEVDMESGHCSLQDK
ncbi:MAG: type VI secretion system baseplate subunit TssE [Phycisphaerae bacterium]